jgi:uncharacterized damage-inducible protein DinB
LSATTAPAEAFIDESRRQLTDGYLPRLERCLADLPEADVWWRPNAASNSIGNLVLHLAGNLRQWLVSGVGGAPDTRRRDDEFAAREGLDRSQLVEHIRAAVADADRALADLDPDTLLERTTVQGRDITRLGAIYHAVEHFGMHTGQVIVLTKLRTGRDLGFYRLEGGIPRRTW